MERLRMRDPRMVVRGFDRPNLWFGAEKFDDGGTKKEALLERVVEAEKPGIVYVATRTHAEEIAGSLRERDVEAVGYHGGMKKAEREEVQGTFMEGQAEVVVATNAFGMGVDKPNVRFVFHYDITDSVDSYYQEIGRAGRDVKEARAILFYRPEDLGLQRFLTGGGQVDHEQVEEVAEAVREKERPVKPRDLREGIDLSQSKLTMAFSRLEEVGAVEMVPTGEVALGDFKGDLAEASEAATRAQEHRGEFERSRIEMMRGYAEVRDCRREYLLNYFGEEFDDPCGYCDNCEVGVVIEGDKYQEPFPINSRVTHQKWGEGMVQRYEGDKMVVLFDEVGYKTLDVELVIERGLLEVAK